MQVPLEVSYREVPRTEQLDTLIREQVERLHRFARGIIAIRVAVENRQPGTTGNPYRVRIEVSLAPGKNLVSKRRPGETDTHRTLETVVQDAFRAMERQLKKVSEQRRGDVKPHVRTTGVVIKLFVEQGYGFLATPEAQELYFHRNAVLNDGFAKLEIGSEVRFVAEMGERGPQASTVQLVNRLGVSDVADEIDGSRIVPDARQAARKRAKANSPNGLRPV